MASNTKGKTKILELMNAFFNPCDDKKYLHCKQCLKKISRGSEDAHKANTTNLIVHLKTKGHDGMFKEYTLKKEEILEEEKEIESSSVREGNDARKKNLPQISLVNMVNLQRWKPDSQKSKELDKKIVEMIAVGNYPFTIVNETGFLRVLTFLEPRAVLKSDKFYREMLDQTYQAVCEKVRQWIAKAWFLSFSSDAWTNKSKTASLLSLTSHFIDPTSGTRHKVILAAIPLHVDHTGENLRDTLHSSVVEKWEIPKEKIHVLIHDNGRNIVRAVQLSELFNDMRCLAHTIQLPIEHGMKVQRVIIDLIAKAIVGHFSMSEKSYRLLHDIQAELGLNPKQLMKCVATRWNSVFYMLERMMEQREALAIYDTRYYLPATLTGNDWKIAANILEILAPFESMTREISNDDTTASVTIPFVKTLIAPLEPREEEGGVGTMRAAILGSMKRRFNNMERDRSLVLATYLDPRFMEGQFSLSPAARIFAEVCMREEFTPTPTQEIESGSSTSAVSHTTPATCSGNTDTTYLEASKRPRLSSAGFWNLVTTTRAADLEDTRRQSAEEETINTLEKELERYKKQSPCVQSTNVFKWWAESNFTILKRAAFKYLSAPATSVPRKQLFSTAGEIYDDNRYRLKAENAEKLLFLNKNLPIIDFKY